MVTSVRRVDRQALGRCWIFVNLNRREISSGDRCLYELLGHAAPTESRQKKIEPSTKINKFPKSGARHTVICATWVDWIREDQLDVWSEVSLCRRTSQ